MPTRTSFVVANSWPATSPLIGTTVEAGNVTVCLAAGGTNATFTASKSAAVPGDLTTGPNPTAAFNLTPGTCTTIWTRPALNVEPLDVLGPPEDIDFLVNVTVNLTSGNLTAPGSVFLSSGNCGGAGTATVVACANAFHGAVVTFHTTPPSAPAVFIIIDEDGIDNDNLPTRFKAVHVNDQKADIGLRALLPVFANPNPYGYPTTFDLWSGQVGDEGWFAPTFIPPSWVSTGPTGNGITNLLTPGPGLGAPLNGDREKLLDKIPGVIPLRAEGLKLLVGRTVCALVWDSDISINYGPINGSLKGANLGLAAFTVNSVTWLTGQSSSSLPKVNITTLANPGAVCQGPFELLNPPVPTSSSTPFDVKPGVAG